MSSIFYNQSNQKRKNYSVKDWIECSLDLIEELIQIKLNSNKTCKINISIIN